MGQYTRSGLEGAPELKCIYNQSCGAKQIEIALPKDPVALAAKGGVDYVGFQQKAQRNGGALEVPIEGTGNPMLDRFIQNETGKLPQTGLSIKFTVEP